MKVGLALLALVFLRHYGSAGLTGVFDLDHRAWFYILGGFQEAILWLFLSAFFMFHVKSWLPLIVCAWGATEGLMIGGCRLAMGYLEIPVSQIRAGQGACDAVTGLPVYSTGLIIMLVLLGAMLCQRLKT